ncbi:MAG: malic enzyme-like NAD(P)-binding protein, partial [Desulfuromonadales bacterium]
MTGSSIGDIRLVRMGRTHNLREMTVYVDSEEQMEGILDNLAKVEGIIVEEVIDLVHQLHEGGKIAMKSRLPIQSIGDIRKIYTPGVASICRDIQKKPELAYRYTAIPNQVAIVTNGSAILGLGDIGAVPGMPVMEGKAALFDRLVGVSGIPILIESKDPKVIIDTVWNIAPTFGAIKLEDIAAPECFEIENALDEVLDIPVMHDDQHGTAVVVLAALLNSLRFSGLMLNKSVIGVVGLGAAGMGISKLLIAYGVKSVIGTDLKAEAGDMLASAGGRSGSLQDVMQ